MSENVTRLAPSPTGALHLGNARSFIINWTLARQRGWKIALRIDDLDSPRVKRGADQQAIADLRWLGIDWDSGPTYQLAELPRYRAALEQLANRGLIYPCRCTRGEIAAARSAPHGDEHELRYPGTCRPAEGAVHTPSPLQGEGWGEGRSLECGESNAHPPHPTSPPLGGEEQSWRVIVPDEPIAFDDAVHGRVETNVQQVVGDFVVATKQGLPAYQLAVVIDDALAGVTQVVRGDDLLGSTARQLLLYRLLERGPTPAYCHLPLVIGEDGRRLAKRHGDTRLSYYRRLGVPPERIIGLLAGWSMPMTERRGMTAEEFAARFDLSKLPRQPVVFTAADDQWLREGATR
ncbi:MAG: tRNA glutamyl-Q(34) synthetase GluQRS [Phycisphaerales bacterium]